MLELAERRMVERIVLHALDADDGMNLFETSLRTLALRDRDGAIERDDWRGPDGHQRVVQPDDLAPIRVFGARCARMNCGDGGFDVILGELGTSRGLIEQTASLFNEV